jgi:hypothetical protein
MTVDGGQEIAHALFAGAAVWGMFRHHGAMKTTST